MPSNYALSWLFSALFIKTNEYCGPNHCSKDRFWFLSKSKIMPQYSPNSFLFSNMKYVSFCICLAMKEKEKTFITRNVYHGLQLSAQANVTPCNLREKILAVFCQDVGLLSSAIGSQLGWHEKRNMALWSNRWVVPNFYYFWHENYRDSLDWVVRWSSEFLNVFSMLLRDHLYVMYGCFGFFLNHSQPLCKGIFST